MAEHPSDFESRKPERENTPQPAPENRDAGILKDTERRKEKESLLLRVQEGSITRRELERLRGLLETSQGIDELRKTLETEAVRSQFAPEHYDEILRIISEVRRLSESDLERLKLEIATVNKGRHYTVRPDVYASDSFDFVRKLEDSEWGENILLDLAGLAVGAGDSAYAVLRLIVDLLLDLTRLPADLASLVRGDSDRK